MENFKEKLKHVKAFIFDVDGVLTDGGLTPTLDGDFVRRYNAKDADRFCFSSINLPNVLLEG